MQVPAQIQTSVYIFGSNAGGALSDEVSITRKPRQFAFPLPRGNASCCFAGDKRTIVVTTTGDAYSWGSDPLGRKSTTHKSRIKPLRIKAVKEAILKVVHGSKHSLLLSSDNSVYSFGDGEFGKLGLERKVRGSITVPQKLNVKNCIDIACGVSTSTLLLTSGEIVCHGLTVGKGTHGSIPCTFQFPLKMQSIACGSSHTVSLSNDGKCFTWGLSENGRLGHGHIPFSNDMLSSPKLVDVFCRQDISLTTIACGSAHTLSVSSTGQLFAFGWSSFGQCANDEDVWTPTLVERVPEAICRVSCGFAHSAFITECVGSLYSFGFNEDGQLGLGHDDNTFKPTQVIFHDGQVNSIVHVDCGNHHTVAISAPCTIAQYRRRQDEIASVEKAIDMIQRFGRKILFRLRGEKLDPNETDFSCEDSNSAKNTCVEELNSTIPNIEEAASSDSESQCSHYSSELSFTKDSTILPSKFQETLAMEAEEEISIILSRGLARNKKAAETRKLRICTELLRRFEVSQMIIEDTISKEDKVTRIEASKDRRHQKEIATQEKRKRDDSARKKRLEKKNAPEPKSMEPPRRSSNTRNVSVIRRNQAVATKTSLPKRKLPAPVLDARIPLLPSTERNKRLLVQRERRLKKQEIERKKEEERHALIVSEKHTMIERRQQREMKLALIRSQKLKSILTEETQRNNTRLLELKRNHRFEKNDSDERGGGQPEFRSIQQWTRLSTG
jgi:alpha-tubulin suppressor-like RCC1 family protein